MSDATPPSDDELDDLLLTACAQRLGLENGPPPVAVQAGRRATMLSFLRGCKDPDDGKSLNVHSVWASFDPDERGLLEVLWLQGKQPMTAWVKGRELLYLEEGW